MNGRIVRDFRILKALERRGFVKLNGTPQSRERHWSGLPVRVITVSEGDKLDNWYTPFEYNGHEYRISYFDGCFHPFVVQLDTTAIRPSFV